MPSRPVRDYQTVIDRLASLSARRWQVRVMGEVGELPFFAVESNRSPADRTVLLTGGVHGDVSLMLL